MTTWLHTVGGFYRNPERFTREARQHGVNRRIAQHLLRNFNFGDVVVVLTWNGGEPQAYGQFVVERLSFQAEVMTAIAPGLIEAGEAVWREGGAVVERDCGSYVDAGGAVLNPDSELTLAEVLARAKTAAATLGIPKLETFIGGTFHAFREPIPVPERPPHQMGYWRTEWRPARLRVRGELEREASGIGEYHLRTRVDRDDPLLAQPEGLEPA